MQVRFTGPLKVAEEGDGTVWRLLDPLTVEVGSEVWQVPAGFRTDFASIPRVFRSLVPVLGRQNRASVLHDYLYKNRLRTRSWADGVFLHAMACTGVRWLKRHTMYAAVRLGGERVWRT